jgi:hypothetical protein
MPPPAGPQSHRTPRDALGKSANPRPGPGPGCSDTVMRRFTRTREIAKETDYSESSAALGRTRKAEGYGSNRSKKGEGTRCQRLGDLSSKIPSAILDEGPQYKSKPLCNHRRTSLLHFADKTDFRELTLLDASKFSNFKVSSKSSSLHSTWHTCPIPNRVSALVPPLALPRRRRWRWSLSAKQPTWPLREYQHCQ